MPYFSRKKTGPRSRKRSIYCLFQACGSQLRKDWRPQLKSARETWTGELAACVYQASRKDAKKLAASGLKAKAQALLEILETDPFRALPAYEKLVGDLAGAYSRRINVQHRLVYEVLEAERIVKIIRMWTHYE